MKEQDNIVSDKLEVFQAIFYPKSVAVVGVSKDGNKSGTGYVRSLLASKFPGKIYPVGRSEDPILGVKSYTSVSSIPEPVDLVLVSVPAKNVPAVFDDCANKVKAIHVFSAGFRETQRAEGIELERQLVEKTKKGGFRVIGPNCIGIYSPAGRLNLGPKPIAPIGEPGNISVVCQSGGFARKLFELGIARRIRYSKLVSFGNAADLKAEDFLEYFAVDPATEIVGAYVEGVSDGKRFLEVVREVAARKPFVLWKGGRTETGSRTAVSHTGAVASADFVWDAALKQAGVVRVESVEELSDTLLAFQMMPSLAGNNACFLCGLADGGGGDSVYSSDLFSTLGLNLPHFSPDVASELDEYRSGGSSIVLNPLDINLAEGEPELLRRALSLALSDPKIDFLIAAEHIGGVLAYRDDDSAREMNDAFIEMKSKQSKPMVVVLTPGIREDLRAEFVSKFTEAGIAVFPSISRAAKAISNILQYYRRNKTR